MGMSKKRRLFEIQVGRVDTGDNEGRGGSHYSRCGVLTVGLGDRERQVKTPTLFSELPNNLTPDLVDHALRGAKSRGDAGKERGLDGFGLCAGYGRASMILRGKDNDSLKMKNKVNGASAALGVPCSSGIVLLSQRSPLDAPLGSSGQQYLMVPLCGGRGKCKVWNLSMCVCVCVMQFLSSPLMTCLSIPIVPLQSPLYFHNFTTDLVSVVQVTPEEFMSVAATLQPDIIVALSDEISGDNIGGKRRDTAASRSWAWLDVCRRQAESSDLVLYADATRHAAEAETGIIQEEGIQGK